VCLVFDADPTSRFLNSFPTRRSSDLDERGNPRQFRRSPEQDRSDCPQDQARSGRPWPVLAKPRSPNYRRKVRTVLRRSWLHVPRSEEHTSELQSPYELVCRLLLEKKK